jgi:hypothetical protein
MDYVHGTIVQVSYDNKSIIDPATNKPMDRAGFASGEKENTIYIDEDCSGDGVCLSQLGDDEFWLNHERGHKILQRIDYPFGRDLYHQEYGANVVACVVTGRQPNFTDDAHGYLACEKEDIALVRNLMITELHIDDLKG